jgi:hypothetical protein
MFIKQNYLVKVRDNGYTLQTMAGRHVGFNATVQQESGLKPIVAEERKRRSRRGTRPN